MKIGENIASLRRQKGVTQEQLAQAVGVSAPAVSKWETDQSLPDIGLLAPIARYFGITIDALLLFQRDLSEQEVQERITQITETFEAEGHAAGMELCRASVREYPDSVCLKLKIAGMFSGYLLYIPMEDRKEENLQEFIQYAVALLEELLKTADGGGRYWTQIKGMLACYLIQLGEYEKAEEHLKDLPRPELNPDELYAMLCLQRGKYEKADEYSHKNWNRYGAAALHALGFLMRSSWETGKDEKLEQLTSAYSVLGELLGRNDGVGADYRIRLALKRQQMDQAEEWFGRLVEQAIRLVEGSDDESSPFNDRTRLRLLKNYEELFLGDESYQALRETERGREALARLRAVKSKAQEYGLQPHAVQD